jgi:hypothetical protein
MVPECHLTKWMPFADTKGMHWAGLALLVCAAVVGLRWMFTRIDPLGRTRSFPVFSVALLLVAGSGALVPWVMRARLEDRLAKAASQIAGMTVDVHCQSFGEAFTDVGAELGYVKWGPDGVPERRTLIKRDQCGDLSDYLKSNKDSPSRDQIVAVHILSHETVHMMGETNEAVTECLAMQRNAEMSRALGAASEQARALAVAYWRDVYPSMPDNYRSHECGPGLSLDAGFADPPWTDTR